MLLSSILSSKDLAYGKSIPTTSVWQIKKIGRQLKSRPHFLVINRNYQSKIFQFCDSETATIRATCRFWITLSTPSQSSFYFCLGPISGPRGRPSGHSLFNFEKQIRIESQSVSSVCSHSLLYRDSRFCDFKTATIRATCRFKVTLSTLHFVSHFEFFSSHREYNASGFDFSIAIIQRFILR